jgi:hypothetical protein
MPGEGSCLVSAGSAVGTGWSRAARLPGTGRLASLACRARARFTRADTVGAKLRRASPHFVRRDTGGLRSLRSLVLRGLPRDARQTLVALLASFGRCGAYVVRIRRPGGRALPGHLITWRRHRESKLSRALPHSVRQEAGTRASPFQSARGTLVWVSHLASGARYRGADRQGGPAMNAREG